MLPFMLNKDEIMFGGNVESDRNPLHIKVLLHMSIQGLTDRKRFISTTELPPGDAL